MDTSGRKWAGEFRNGRFESKLQKELIKERQVIVKKNLLGKEVERVINSML